MRDRFIAAVLAVGPLVALLPGTASSQSRRPIQFADGTAYAGLDFRHDTEGKADVIASASIAPR